MRALIYQMLSTAPTLMKSGTGVVTDIYTANSLGTDPVPAVPPSPFLIVQEQTPSVPFQLVRKTGHSTLQNFAIRCYTVRGDYTLIDQTLILVRDILLGAEWNVSPSGIRCTAVKWMGFGPDGDDPDLDMIFKACTMQFVSNIKKQGA